MRTVSTGQLEPGMVLAKPVVMKNGMILFGGGTELTEDYIERICNMAVGNVQIEGNAPCTESQEQLLEKLNQRFRLVEQQPYMRLLKRLVEEQMTEQNG
jgi:hypothetical protein